MTHADPPAAAALVAHLSALLAQADADLCCAWLFGSHARGSAGAQSDVDVAVLFGADPPVTLAGLHLDLADRLRGALGRPVDLVVLNRAPVDLAWRVLRDGVLLLERDRARRIRYQVRMRNEYLDLLPYLQLYRRVGAPAAGARP